MKGREGERRGGLASKGHTIESKGFVVPSFVTVKMPDTNNQRRKGLFWLNFRHFGPWLAVVLCLSCGEAPHSGRRVWKIAAHFLEARDQKEITSFTGRFWARKIAQWSGVLTVQL